MTPHLPPSSRTRSTTCLPHPLLGQSHPFAHVSSPPPRAPMGRRVILDMKPEGVSFEVLSGSRDENRAPDAHGNPPSDDGLPARDEEGSVSLEDAGGAPHRPRRTQSLSDALGGTGRRSPGCLLGGLPLSPRGPHPGPPRPTAAPQLPLCRPPPWFRERVPVDRTRLGRLLNPPQRLPKCVARDAGPVSHFEVSSSQ